MGDLEKMDLSLKQTKEVAANPLWGWFAVGFGVASLIVPGGAVFVPMGLLCSVVSLFREPPIWGLVGLMLTVLGILTSPVLLGILGLSMLGLWLPW